MPARPSPGAAGARLGELYTGNARMVYGLCRMLLDDPDEAEDATQQVFLSAYRGLLTGTAVEKPAAWLGTIARNECKARYTARSRNPVALHDTDTLVSPGADEQAVGRADVAELYSEVAALPETQRAAVVLRDIYGLRYDEVAAALGTSRPAVEALLFRGRRRLQRRLRPGLAAGVLVVPLSLHESLAYAVPGFAAAAPVGAAASMVVAPLLAKVAAVGAAAALAGSAGFVAEREIRDRPARPAGSIASVASPKPAALDSLQASPARSLVSATTPLLDARTAKRAETRDAEQDKGDDQDGPSAALRDDPEGTVEDATKHGDPRGPAGEDRASGNDGPADHAEPAVREDPADDPADEPASAAGEEPGDAALTPLDEHDGVPEPEAADHGGDGSDAVPGDG